VGFHRRELLVRRASQRERVESVNSPQANSRIGGAVSVSISKHHSLKFSNSRGAVVRVGGNYHNVSVPWQYAWLCRPNLTRGAVRRHTR
jgi:hypothetical protein